MSEIKGLKQSINVLYENQIVWDGFVSYSIFMNKILKNIIKNIRSALISTILEKLKYTDAKKR